MTSTTPLRSIAVLFLVAAATTLTGCGTTRGGGYYQDDGPGGRAPNIDKIPDAVPKVEPLARTGNSPYEALGKNYAPLADARGYRERGIASWYGKKFHGKRTSSGEPYDMYTMTAAHRVLPIPCYVRVRNLQNGRTVIVRVNDRGPFLNNRLIDLSYAAATKLGIVGTGTGMVEVEVIMPGDEAPASQVVKTQGFQLLPSAEAAPLADLPSDNSATPAPATTTPPPPVTPSSSTGTPKIFIQVGAFREFINAENLRSRLERAAFTSVAIQLESGENAGRLYRVRIGPLANVDEGDRVTEKLSQQGLPDTLIVVE